MLIHQNHAGLGLADNVIFVHLRNGGAKRIVIECFGVYGVGRMRNGSARGRCVKGLGLSLCWRLCLIGAGAVLKGVCLVLTNIAITPKARGQWPCRVAQWSTHGASI